MKLEVNTRDDAKALLELFTSDAWTRLLLPSIREHVLRLTDPRSIRPEYAQYDLGVAHGQRELLDGWENSAAVIQAMVDEMDRADAEAVKAALRAAGAPAEDWPDDVSEN